MGCIQSKEVHRKGLFTQQESIIKNNNKVILRAENDGSGPSSSSSGQSALFEDVPSAPPRQKDRYSPPASRPTSTYTHTELEELGSLKEVWSNPDKWAEFRLYLATVEESRDADTDMPFLADRYAIFLELYADLYGSERDKKPVKTRLELFNRIARHDQQFFSRDNYLKSLDGGVWKEVTADIKAVNNGADPRAKMFARAVKSVVDRLVELLGNYQNTVKEKNEIANRQC